MQPAVQNYRFKFLLFPLGEDLLEIQLQQAVETKDVLVTDVYSNVPRSAPFIIKCTNDKKLYMSQLSDIDFDQAANLKGLSIASAENLRKIYIKFIYSPSLPEDYSVNESLHSSSPIHNLPLSVRAKNCLKQAGKFKHTTL